MRAATPATDSIAIRAAKARAAQLLKQSRSRVATAARLQDARDAFAIARAARAAEAAPMAVDLIAAPPRGEDEEWIESFDDHYQAPRPRGFVTTRRLRERNAERTHDASGRPKYVWHGPGNPRRKFLARPLDSRAGAVLDQRPHGRRHVARPQGRRVRGDLKPRHGPKRPRASSAGSRRVYVAIERGPAECPRGARGGAARGESSNRRGALRRARRVRRRAAASPSRELPPSRDSPRPTALSARGGARCVRGARASATAHVSPRPTALSARGGAHGTPPRLTTH